MSFIEIKNAKYSYNEGTASEVRAVNDISLNIEEGEFVALVGHNGSGKSTIAKLLNGLVLPQQGTVSVNGMLTADKRNLFDIRKTLGVVFQNPDNQMVATIIEDDIAFGPENIGVLPDDIRQRVDWALKSVGMYDYRSGTPFRLSGGQKQRVAIAGVLALKPRVMVLDESTSMLDPVGRNEVMRVVETLNKKEKMTVIMITHFMEEALLADRIVVLDKGKILLEGGREIFEHREAIERAGLDIPIVMKVRDKLAQMGMQISRDIKDADALVEELCR